MELLNRWSLALLLTAAVGAQAPRTIVHSGFEAFSRGTLGDSGWNLFLSRAGKIQMIHRWDFNNDGYLDLFVGQEDHYRQEDSVLYWGGPEGPRSLLPELASYLPLGKLLDEIDARRRGAMRLPSAGGGRSLLADLNRDGYLDLVLCNQSALYTENTEAYIYWGASSGYDPTHRTVLPTLEASGVAAGDFNGDGFTDLAFSNEGLPGTGRFGYDNHRESYVYWNGPVGFSTERRTTLASVSARDCASADVNGDGIADLLILNNNPEEQSIYTYFGSHRGFAIPRRQRRPVTGGLGLDVEDVNRDGKADLVVLTADNRASIFRGNASGFDTTAWDSLPTIGASHCHAADLNKDGYPDLVIANDAEVSYIYWGSASGFAVTHRTELPTEHATDAAVADFNNDGWTDVVFTNRKKGRSFDAASYLYWNGPNGFHPAARKDLQGFGPWSTQAADFNHDGFADLLLVSSNSGNSEPCDSFIYWGNPSHTYSPASMTAIATGSTQPAPAAADFNQDGYVDFAFPGGWIYWGGPNGYSESNRQDLKTHAPGGGVSSADLNRDGYLDLVVAAPRNGHSTGIIYWGGPSGYDPARATELKLSTTNSLSPTIADFNKDGHLDLLFTDIDSSNADFVWGSGTGAFGPDHHTHMMLHSTTTVEMADLNRDGWLDLVMGGVYDEEDHGRPMRYLTILWGGAQGYSTKRQTRLEAYELEQQSIADLNKDGYLDIVVSNFHGRTTRSIPVFIYWGGPDGTYRESRRSVLPAESSLDLTLADLNHDGWIDIVDFNHMGGADHSVGSNIYWGGPKGFSAERRQPFPTIGPAFGVRYDQGNLYTRKLEEEYLSPPVPLPPGTESVGLSWHAETPHGTSVRMNVRTAPTRQALANAPWRGAPGNGMRLQPLSLTAGDVWLQYKAVLATPDGGSTPALDRVEIQPAGSAIR